MPDVKISALPAGTANANAVVPATNAAGTTTEKITLGAIAALGGGAPASHAASHYTGGSDALTAHSITTTDQSVASLSLTDATNMSFSAAANATYLVSMLIVAFDDGGGGFKAKVVVPSGANANGYWDQFDNAVYVSTDVPVTSEGDLLLSTQDGLYGFPRQFMVKTAATAGTVKLQFRQDATGAGTAAILKAGSWISAQRIS